MPEAKPTLVIGVGQGGVRMLEHFNKSIQRENVDENQFNLFAIDSAEDIENNFSYLHDSRRFVLEKPMGWDQMVNEYPYLKHGDEPGRHGGVTRNRPVARGLLDSENFSIVYNRLETEVKKLLEHSTDANIWILSSLGGGTGSGVQPFLSTIVYDVVRKIDTEGNQEPRIYINGIGSIPRLSNLDGPRYPDAKAEYIANSYVALREIRSLFERDFSNDPIEINVYAKNRGSLKNSQIPPINEPPLDRYFVLPVEEKELTTTGSRDRINGIVSDTILYFSSTNEIENYPDLKDVDIDYEEKTIFTINEATISMPIEELKEYVALDKKIFQLGKDETKLKQLQDTYERNTEFLNHILRAGRGVVPEKGGFNNLVNECKKSVENTLNSVAIRKISDSNIEEQKEKAIKNIREQTESLNNRFEDSRQIGNKERSIEDDVPMIANGDINPVNEVIQYFYYDQLHVHLKNIIEARKFANTVDSVWEIHGADVVAAMQKQGELDDSIEAVKRGDTEERYERLKRWLEYRLSELENDQDGILSGFFGGSDIESEKDTLKKLITNLKDEKANEEQLHALRDSTETNRTAVRERLRDLRDQFEIAVDNVSEDISNVNNEIKINKDKKDALTDPDNNESLVDFFSEQFASFSVSNPDRLSQEDIEEIENGEWDLADMVDSPAWDKDDVLINLKDLLENHINERITDQARTPVYGILQIMRHENNSWIDEEIRKTIKHSRAPIHKVPKAVKDWGAVSDPLELRFLATYPKINWSETSEFGSIDRALSQDTRSAVSMFVDTDEEDEDEIQEQYFRPAYPELY